MAVKVKVTTITKKNRTPEILAALRRAQGSFVTIGVHRGAGAYPAVDGRTPPTVDKVAFWLEYGTENMPARPFMYPAMQRNKAAITRIAAKGLAGVAYLKHSVAQGLGSLGSACVTMIQDVVKSNVGPPLSGTWDPPSGYLGWRRQHYPEAGQRTLIASGLLLRSVAFVLHLRGVAAVEQKQAEAMNADQGSKADKRAEGIKRGQEMKQRQRDQKASAKADPAAARAAFGAQKRAYVRAPRGTPKK